jgi:hypothetical protein
MIPESEKGATYFAKGAGRPFDMPERKPIEKNDAERQGTPLLIDLSDLNEGKVPKNYHRKATRKLMTFTKYWSPEGQKANEEGFDVE